MSKRATVTQAEIEAKAIDPDTPLRLDMAAKVAFPNGGMTANGLRREHKRGRLDIERVAGKDYTTLNHIKRMREICRVSQSRQDSASNQNSATKLVELPAPPYGQSLMEVASSELDAALRIPKARIGR